MPDDAGQKSRPHILESIRRAVKQLERIDVVLDLDQRDVEGKCIVHYLPYLGRVYLVAQHEVGHDKRYVAHAHPGYIVEESRRYHRYTLGHIQSTVGCQSRHHGLSQPHGRRLSVCAI